MCPKEMRSPDGNTSVSRASCMRRHDYFKWHFVNNTQSRITINISPPKNLYTPNVTHAPSLDYIFSSVHVKNLPPTEPQEDAWPRCRSERLPLNIHKTVMTTRAESSFRMAQNAALTPLYGGNCYIHQMSQLCFQSNYACHISIIL